MNVKLPLVIGSFLLTAVCWGVYGPLLHIGQVSLGGNRLRAFLCVGLAYFLIAVVVPLLMMSTSGKKSEWSVKGLLWSLLAGTAGALGALGVILAFNFGGKPVYVMPLVFGCAPVVNSFWTIYWQNTWKDINAFFAAGLILVAVGAASVLFFAPTKPPAKPAAVASADSKSDAGAESKAVESKEERKSGDEPSAGSTSIQTAAAAPAASAAPLSLQSLLLRVVPCVLLTACCWGVYGPLLHWGQMGLGGNRLQAFLCVGLAYFVIAVLAPAAMLGGAVMEGWSMTGIFWSLFGGVAGAFGALGIIFAFNFGGKPVYVMPLVFGCAPVVNAFFTMSKDGTWAQVNAFFAAGLILAAVGAMTVLFFAPVQHGPPKKAAEPAGDKPADEKPADDKTESAEKKD